MNSASCHLKNYKDRVGCQPRRIHSGALAREARASGALWVSKSTHPRTFGYHVTVHRTNERPSVRPHHKHTNVQSHTFWQVWEHRKTDIVHILHINFVINWQLSKQDIRWLVSPDRIAGSRVHPSRSSIFLKLSIDRLLVFKRSQAQAYFFFQTHMKYVVFMCRTIKSLISNWSRTWKFSQLLQAGRTVAFDFSHHGLALVTLYA